MIVIKGIEKLLPKLLQDIKKHTFAIEIFQSTVIQLRLPTELSTEKSIQMSTLHQEKLSYGVWQTSDLRPSTKLDCLATNSML